VSTDTLQTLFRVFLKQETFEFLAERIWVPFVWAVTLCNLVGHLELRHPRCVCIIRYGQDSQTQQIILII